MHHLLESAVPQSEARASFSTLYSSIFWDLPQQVDKEQGTARHSLGGEHSAVGTGRSCQAARGS